MNKLITAFFGASMALALNTASAEINRTVIEHTRINDEAMIKAWGITKEDLTRYREYMQTTGKYFFSHLDPVMVLGITSDNFSDRDRFAELYIQNEVERMRAQDDFITAVGHAHTRLYANTPRYNFAKVAGYKEHQDSVQLLASKARKHYVKSVPAEQQTASIPSQLFDSYEWDQPNALVSVDLLVEDACDACLTHFDALLAQSPTDVIINIFLKGEQKKVTDALKSSAAFTQAPPARIINFKRYDPLLWDVIDYKALPVAVIRHNGIAVARGK